MLSRIASRSTAVCRRAFSTAAAAAAPSRGRKSTPLMHSVVLMASGPDDKDVLSLITNEVAKLNGNLEESRMTNLGGDFSLVSLVTLPMTSAPADLSARVLEALPDFTVSTRLTSAAPSAAASEPAKMLAIDVEGPDQPGIVSSFAEVMTRHRISVRDLITDTSSAPFLGYNVFAMKSVIAVPLKAEMNALEADLQQFEEHFGLSVGVSDPSEVQNGEDQQQQQQQ